MLARWERSDQTGRDFCRSAGLSEPSFYAWRREMARRDAAAPPRFLPVRVLPDPAPGTTLEVMTPSGHVIRVHAGFDATTLRDLLAAQWAETERVSYPLTTRAFFQIRLNQDSPSESGARPGGQRGVLAAWMPGSLLAQLR